MDRDKRRSKEEEEELDRKIALIREKNQKIEKRSREVEADRAQNAEATPKKPSQAPQHHQPPKTGGRGGKTNKTWDREWDQGKTPAETWRENVPSIEHTGRLASAQPQQQKNHRKGQQNKPNDQTNRGGRLEGRVSYANEKSAKGKGNEGGRKEGGRQVQQNKTGELIISVKPIAEGQGRGEHGRGDHGRGERHGRRQRGNSDRKAQDPAEKEKKPEEQSEKGQKQKKRRPRRENDKYAVKITMMRLLDRVEKLERRRKRDETKENQKQENPIEDKQEQDDGATPFEEKQNPTVPIVEKPEADEKKADPIAEEPPKEPGSVKEEKPTEKEPDANQNVITLTKERVLTVQMAT